MRLSSLALGGLLLAATGSIALAQAPMAPSKMPPPVAAPAGAAPAGAAPAGAASPAMGNVVPGKLGDAAADNPFAVAGIDPASPFGEIDVDLSTNPDELAVWQKTLTKAQVTELDQRCDVITTASNLAPEPLAFCDMWLTVRSGEEGDPAAAALTVPAPGGGFTQLPAPEKAPKAL
jgi:hypothetical protein